MAHDRPHLLMLDEPTNPLDMNAIDSLARAINSFAGGCILVSHDMRLISQVCLFVCLCVFFCFVALLLSGFGVLCSALTSAPLPSAPSTLCETVRAPRFHPLPQPSVRPYERPASIRSLNPL